ncbi:chalcone isomerase [Tothia fuscella]|uniref:Chalcone isomerase n=1 Tax=Tothia fuscella TaxID=1048955 RepID=A0A9P4NWL5_9PEZI|nr:chalcone isomerase [Tothia fuscella]
MEGESERFQGKPVVVAPGGTKIIAVDEKAGEDVELVETGTSTVPHFPKTIHLPSSSANSEDTEYTLLGLGIRTVSFLSIQVYVVGLYVQTSSLASLQKNLIQSVNPMASALIPDEKDELKKRLLDGEESHKIWNTLLTDANSQLNMAVRIVPTRSTDFGHLRDGWVRGITSKTQTLSSTGPSEFADDSFGAALKEFKTLLAGKGKAPTNSVIILKRDTEGVLTVLYQSKDGVVNDFGRVQDERIGRLIWLGYLGGKSVSSEGARKGVVDGVMELVERPVGSVETKVS